MNHPDIKIEVSLVTDERFATRQPTDIFAGVTLPDAARGFKRGPRFLMANAMDTRDMVVACSIGLLLEHPAKAPILYVGTVTANPPHTAQTLGPQLVEALRAFGRAIGISGVWVSDEVTMTLNAGEAPEPEPGRASASAPRSWWSRLWQRPSK